MSLFRNRSTRPPTMTVGGSAAHAAREDGNSRDLAGAPRIDRGTPASQLRGVSETSPVHTRVCARSTRAPATTLAAPGLRRFLACLFHFLQGFTHTAPDSAGPSAQAGADPLPWPGPCLISVCAACQSVYAVRLGVGVPRLVHGRTVQCTEMSHGYCAACAARFDPRTE